MTMYAGLESKHADRNRLNLPGAGELAAMLRAGATREELAADYNVAPRRIDATLNDGGYTRNGENAAHVKPPTPEPAFPFQRPDDWTDAYCAGPDAQADWWHAEGAGAALKTRNAKKLCAEACPINHACLMWALTLPADVDKHGIYGGTDPDQRAELRGNK